MNSYALMGALILLVAAAVVSVVLSKKDRP
jgi:hypothetical protein